MYSADKWFVPYEENGEWWYKLPPLSEGGPCPVLGPFSSKDAAEWDATQAEAMF